MNIKKPLYITDTNVLIEFTIQYGPNKGRRATIWLPSVDPEVTRLIEECEGKIIDRVQWEEIMSVINIDDKRPHEVAELMCVKCFHRYIGMYLETTPLKHLKCPNCGRGFIIKTGQTLKEETKC